MFLTDSEIIEAIEKKRIQFSPRIKKSNVRPVGVRIRLSEFLFVPLNGKTVDASNHSISLDDYFEKVDFKDKFILKPNDFILAYTHEKLKTSNDLIPILDGRSTLARLGLTIHQSAFVIDNMHYEYRHIMLEIKNAGKFNIILRPRMAVGMLVFSNLSEYIKQEAQDQYVKQSSKKLGGKPQVQYKLFNDLNL